MAMELIETIEVGAGGAASIEFTSIPQDGVDLLLMVSGRSDNASNGDFAYVKLNNDATDTNYARRALRGTGSSVSSFGGTYFGGLPNPLSGDTANTFGNSNFYVSNYAGSTTKSYSIDGVAENNATAADQILIAGNWNNTSAITTVTVFLNSANFVQYTTASLYKVS